MHRPMTLRLLELNGDPVIGDHSAIHMIEQQLKGYCTTEVVHYSPDPFRFLREIARCNVMLSMRLHSAVFAFLVKVPIVMLSYHPKCLGLVREIGLDARWTFDADDFNPAELSSALLDRCEGEDQLLLTVHEAVASAHNHIRHLFA
jgi:polysaccharide pyruvyl transferase WcaK-like protein